MVLVFAGSRTTQVIDDGGLFLLLSLTVLGGAWLAGTGNALAVTIGGAVMGAFQAETAPQAAVGVHLAVFVVQGLLLTALVAELRRSWRAAERQARVAEAARIEAETAGRMKDEFLATISHELRTPLNAVLGWLYLIRTGKLDDRTRARGFESIERNVRQQAQLTGDLLDISKALTGTLRLETRPVALRQVIRDAASQVAPAAAAKDVRLRISAADTPVVVRGDPTRLRQVVWHLLANAIKFTPRGGHIDVTLDVGSQASVTVRDSGAGIDPAFLPFLFDRFTQADASPTRAAGGLGVGLSLVRELVERHGGEISAQNAPGGVGAQFAIRLPLHAGDEEAAAAASSAPQPVDGTPTLSGIRVLLLERDQDARELFTVALRQRGAAVRGAASVDEALEMLDAWRPDVLVTDATSPEHDSYAVVGKVQTLESDRGGRIPAVALTAARGDGPMSRLVADVQRDLPKPVEPAILSAEIARLVGKNPQAAER
jgi:signal transduction histidine kinase/CheY-like chemotaxis protein